MRRCDERGTQMAEQSPTLAALAYRADRQADATPVFWVQTASERATPFLWELEGDSKVLFALRPALLPVQRLLGEGLDPGRQHSLEPPCFCLLWIPFVTSMIFPRFVRGCWCHNHRRNHTEHTENM